MPNPWDKPQAAPAAAPAQGNPWDRPAEDTGDMVGAPEGTLAKIGGVVKDLGIGALKGAGSTANSIGHILMPDWALKLAGVTPPTAEQQSGYFDPTDAAQKIGKGAEQTAEFLAPTGVEEAGTKLGAKLLPRGGEVLGKIAGAGLHSGAVNKVQGGDFSTGAAAGAAGAGAGLLAKKIAPVLAETALKVRGADRAYGATPGRAILDETSGFAPSRIVDTARNSLKGIQAEQGNVLKSAPGLIDLKPARGVGSNFLDQAIDENHPGTIKDLGKLNDQLLTQYDPHTPTLQELTAHVKSLYPKWTATQADAEARKMLAQNIQLHQLPQFVAAPKAGALNRGISNAITSWNPATATDTMTGAGRMMHHQLGESIADVVPEIRPLNQRVQSLMPVLQRGTAADLNAGLTQRTLGRLQAHTGALAGMGIGGGVGYERGGLPGAVIGGAAGLALPELLSSPETQMMAARALNSEALPKIAMPAMQGTALQLDRPDYSYEDKEVEPGVKLPVTVLKKR